MAFFNAAPVDVVCQRQHATAPDIHSAELHAFSTAVGRLMPLAGMLHEMGVRQLTATPLLTDSSSSIFVATSEASVRRSVWTMRRAMHCQWAVDNDVVDPQHCPGDKNLADVNTKYLPLAAWQEHMRVILNMAAHAMK